MPNLRALTLFLFTTIFLSACSEQKPASAIVADTIYYNGPILTMEDAQKKVAAIAVKDGKIIQVGTDEVVGAHNGEKTQMIDLEGKTLLPGFVDAHSHIGLSLQLMD